MNTNPLEARSVGLETLMTICQESESEDNRITAAETLLVQTSPHLSMEEFIHEAVERHEEEGDGAI